MSSTGGIVDERKRWVYNFGRDGFLYKMDLVTLKPLARIRVGIDSRAIAVSDDGLHVIVSNYIPFSAVIINTATMQPNTWTPQRRALRRRRTAEARASLHVTKRQLLRPQRR